MYQLHRLTLFLFRLYHCFPLFGSQEAKRNAILSILYKETSFFLRQINEPYWLDFGTLLGYHRENGIIRHDVDVDFSMMAPSFSLVWTKRHLLPKGFTLHDTSFRHFGPKLYVSYKGFDADIYFYEENENEIRSFEKTTWMNERQWIPKNLIFPLKQVQFLEHDIYIPNQTGIYLEYLYGYIGTRGYRDPASGFWQPPI